MDALENLMTRRSIRAFTEDTVPQEALERIVDAARYAPSGMNKQLWRFTVVQNPAMLDALAAVIREEAGRDPDYHFYHANVLILGTWWNGCSDRRRREKNRVGRRVSGMAIPVF